ncbi:MAG TPA: hypothetical protein VMI52_05690 [Acetobacteraceae bacterium]|nr:hypothetical protein [Acetobacteraceae bacterium]
MDGTVVQDRIARGAGIAARRLGTVYDVYRPCGVDAPLAPGNRVVRLSAAFLSEDGRVRKPSGYARAAWFGMFDYAYTRPGDFLSGAAGVFFVARQALLEPAICVLTNRVLGFSRPAAANAVGVNAGYGGVTRTGSVALGSGWAASVLASGGGERGTLPSDQRAPQWDALLPALPFSPRPADLVTDEAGRGYGVVSAEESEMGWRLVLQSAAG